MKKIALCLALVLSLLVPCSLPVLAAPQTSGVAEGIKSIAKSESNVKDAACIVFAGTCGLALKCGDMYFQSDKNQLKTNIVDKIKSAYPQIKNVMIKCDMDIYLRTKKIEDKLASGKSLFSMKDEIIELLRLADKRE